MRSQKHCHLLLRRRCSTLKELQQIHGQAVARGLHPHHQPLSCQLLNAYAELGEADRAVRLFREIPSPDLVSVTSVMSVFLQSGDPFRALSLFSQVASSGRKPDGFAVVGALSACGRTGDLRTGKLVHGMVCRHGLGSETVVGNALIDMYCRNGRMESAQRVFDGTTAKDSVTWSSMLHGCIKCGGLEFACQFFDGMPERDAVSWTVMITGHVQGKKPVRALQFFRQMVSEGHSPTTITTVGVLSACADIGALDLGRAIHGRINKVDSGHDVTVHNALVDMYSKSGNASTAYQIFSEMLRKDVFSWTSMISGFAVQGDGTKAMEVFSSMLKSGVAPNEVTFVAVLSACSHAGLIDEGRRWFGRMQETYGFAPQMEHYGCMINLLGRAGLLDEAKMLMETMRTEPDAIMWRSLLSACLAHGNDRLAEVAGKAIIKKEPEDDGVYVLLWNMYASSKKWKEALEMRRRMWSRKVIKQPGFSWIEIDGFVHEFLVQDRAHYLRSVIYTNLESMAKHLKSEGEDGYIGLIEENEQGDDMMLTGMAKILQQWSNFV